MKAYFIAHKSLLQNYIFLLSQFDFNRVNEPDKSKMRKEKHNLSFDKTHT